MGLDPDLDEALKIAVREAIEQKHWPQADEAILVVAHVLQGEAELISSAAQKLSAAK